MRADTSNYTAEQLCELGMLLSGQRATHLVKYDVTQFESCLSISPNPLFAVHLAGNAQCVYARGYSNILLQLHFRYSALPSALSP